MHQIRFPLGLRPRPRWGAYSAPQTALLNPLAVFKGPTSKGMDRGRVEGGKKKGRRMGNGREREGRGGYGRRGEGICQTNVKLLPTRLQL